MTWTTPCYYNLEPLRSEVCHHKMKEITCSESDFDEIDRVRICDKVYIRTQQGMYLVGNGTIESKNRKHYFSAAIIQHLYNKIEELESQIQCLVQNSHCARLNEIVRNKHQIIFEFTRS